jgi:microcystin-dependent protein
MDFPSSPTNGQVANGYTYDSAKNAWRKNPSVTVSVTTSAVAPSNPNPGDQWLYTNEGTLFTWWNDGTSSQWVQSSSVIANADPNPMPAGAIMAWGTNTAPQNWLLCDGAAVSRSTYASLFAAIGTTYGSGDGTTTFNLPNMKGKTIVGRDAADTNFDALNTPSVYVGAKTHTLTAAQIPSHTHTYSGTTSTTGSHNHINGWASITGYNYVGSGGNSTWPFGGGSNAAQRDLQAAGDHAHTFSGTTAANTGGDGAHNNLQPYIVLNYIIKASAGVTPGDSVLTTRVGALETQNNLTPLSENYIINGGMDVWQRGTSFSYSSPTIIYTADRWSITNAGGSGSPAFTVSRQSGATTPSRYCLRFQRNSSNTATTYGYLAYSFESADSVIAAGRQVTLSFYARSGANYSPTSSILNFRLVTGTGTDQSLNSTGFTGQVNTDSTATLSTSWQRYSLTITAQSNTNQLGVQLWSQFTGTAGAADYYEITGVQVELGAYATPFRRNAPSIQAELATCQRYFVLFSAGTVEIFNSYFGVALSSGNQRIFTQFPIEMRVAPSVLTSAGSALNYFTYYPSNASSNGSVLISLGASDTKTMYAGFSNSNNGGNSLAAVYATGTNTNSIYVSAEL